MFWRGEAHELRSGIITRAKKLILDEYMLLKSSLPLPSNHSVVTQGIRKLEDHADLPRSIKDELLRYLDQLEHEFAHGA